MDFPQRYITHSIERKAIEILSSYLPVEWIVREMTERDYGIDLYIEIVNEDRKVTGNLIAIQVKGKTKIDFDNSNQFKFRNIKRSTINYWTHLPVPVFFIVVCTTTRTAYWASINEQNRRGFFEGDSATTSVLIEKEHTLTGVGIKVFQYIYIREKRWPAVENAMENALMSFSSFGPFCLICRRKPEDETCSTTIQYLLLSHYENCNILTRYLHGKKPEPIIYWYDKHRVMIKNGKAHSSFRFTYKLIQEMLMHFAGKYRESVRVANLLVLKHQSNYFAKRFPFLYLHLKERPLTFAESDWYARYYWDEYENETQDIERKFFDDFEVFDDYDLINDLNI